MIGVITRSVFAKLFIVLVVTGVLVNVVVFEAFRRFSGPHHRIHSTFSKFSEYVEADLLKDLSVDRARRILDKTGIDVRAEGATEWATNPEVPHYSDLAFYESKHPFFQGRHGKSPFWVREKDTKKGKVRLIFMAQPGPPFDHTAADVTIISLLLTLIITLSFLTIRRLLRPIYAMAEGVAALTAGNLEHQVPVAGDDELARLAGSFNQMIRRLQEMVRGKEQLLLDVSHELRSPITRAKLALEFLPPSETKDSLQNDLREVETMIHELLESARLKGGYSALQLSHFDLIPVIEAQAIKQSPEGNIRILEKPASLPVTADRERIKTVLKNVLENAIKYSSPEPKVELHLYDTGENARIVVRDYGVGISADEIPHLFEPFYRVDKSRTRETGGYGLGLSLTQNILVAHGGNVSVSSEVGKSTTVTIDLPKTQKKIS